MDQGVIATAKAIYKKITFPKVHETHETLVDFLKDYDVLQAVKKFVGGKKNQKFCIIGKLHL